MHSHRRADCPPKFRLLCHGLFDNFTFAHFIDFCGICHIKAETNRCYSYSICLDDWDVKHELDLPSLNRLESVHLARIELRGKYKK